MCRKKSLLLVLAATPLVALAEARYDEAEVIDVEPVIETVEYIEPEEQCRFEAVRTVSPQRDSYTKPLIGALIGGAIGNAMGTKKRNKKVGAVIGALVGGSIATDIAYNPRPQTPRGGQNLRREVCEVVDHVKPPKARDGLHGHLPLPGRDASRPHGRAARGHHPRARARLAGLRPGAQGVECRPRQWRWPHATKVVTVPVGGVLRLVLRLRPRGATVLGARRARNARRQRPPAAAQSEREQPPERPAPNDEDATGRPTITIEDAARNRAASLWRARSPARRRCRRSAATAFGLTSKAVWKTVFVDLSGRVREQPPRATRCAC